MSDIVGAFRGYALDKDNCPRMDTEVVYVRVGLLMEAADRIEQLEAALDILQAAMTAKKPIPMAFKKAILEARAVLEASHDLA